jgi:hypothetical protein
MKLQMNTCKRRLKINSIASFFFFASFLIFAGCQRNAFQSPAGSAPTALRDVPALRFNFRFETDVPAPTITQPLQTEERNAAVQADFDNNRTQEVLDKTLTSPDKQRVLAIYHKNQDSQGDFRLDMYSPDGKLLRRITPEGMAVHYPDTIIWSPDSTSIAVMAKTRVTTASAPPPEPALNQPENQANANQTNTDLSGENANTGVEANANAAPAQTPTVEAATPVLTFRTEQIYICDRDGGDLKPVTQNEGLIYFYFVWSPDGAALAALAATNQEWNYLQYQADLKQELFVPQGRPRLVEKNGRERRLDDNLTVVRPVWSPDSAKVAVAFDKQVRIYDAIGNQPTQAAIPLRNQMLISSKAFDENLRRQEEGAANGNAAPVNNQDTATLPDENSLVSFNPIISLEWTADEMLYLQTGYIKLMKNEADSARSYLRWHRLIFSPQADAIGN